MEIFLNGEIRQVEDKLLLTALIKELSLENKRLAVEVNEDIVPRSQFDCYILSAGDKVEIVRAIGGG
ncbi:MAG: thiamine biosynthesis protein ThiS [Gammaproteobacteria bacterium]|nr:MAG: thiamine biosynthesis protein ThiS [Gammaproteobacteria bacterium]RKZ40067.1 MAG: thiamine biosynthesis protein ThiS [Gammaproteobacteria bacterium]RKZ77055.1 MAG: thiamine biosynthesis protein ThiS [Gammaproteobacteria bacterium]